MKERGMLFNGEMVRAILDGRKTLTRRPVKNVGGDNCLITKHATKTKTGLRVHVIDSISLCPYGVVGDRIWVRETHVVGVSTKTGVGYKATSKWEDFEDGTPNDFAGINWIPSIHMPRWSSRITLEITDVRVERVRDISEEEARSEGFQSEGWSPSFNDPCNSGGADSASAREKFFETWSAIYPGSWECNDWVWVIEFKRLEE